MTTAKRSSVRESRVLLNILDDFEGLIAEVANGPLGVHTVQLTGRKCRGASEL